MIVRLVVLSTVLGGAVFVAPQVAAADCQVVEQVYYVQGYAEVSLVSVCDDVVTAPSSGGGQEPPRDSELDAICVQIAISTGTDPFDFCDIPPDAVLSEVTPGMVAAALARIPLPASELQVQPANGRTLVNFETNFYTSTGPLERTVPMLGQQVELHIVPSQFGWRFGDGEQLLTDRPGAPYPQLEVTHSYLSKGTVAPSVDTTYTATYRVNGGPWAPVPGSVTIPGPPVTLEVLTATPTLVGYGSPRRH